MPTAVSAPGKVLLAGGYLVLDRAYTGLVFGLSARMHVLVEDIDTSTGIDLSEIVVQSPQFRDATWRYGYHLTEGHGGVDVTQLQGYENFYLPPRLHSLTPFPLSSPLFHILIT
jgi:phosphomevalonate kinase